MIIDWHEHFSRASRISISKEYKVGPMHKCQNFLSKLIVACALTVLLTACGEGDVCRKTDVLTTVKKLFQEKEFGKFYQLPDGVAFVKDKTATFISTDKQTSAVRCTVVVTVDLLQILKNVQGFDDEYVAKAKANAAQTGQKTQEDTLVNFMVQTVKSGENFVTLLQ